MNILMLGWELPPHNSGGLGVACYYMSKALALKGASIDFVVPYAAHHPKATFMKVHAATNLNPLERYGLGAYDSASFNIEDKARQAAPSNIREVQAHYGKYVEKLAKTKTPDAIHVHDWLTMEAGIRAKEITDAPLIVHIHATEFDRSGERYGNPIVHEIEQQGLLMADRIIAVSNITKSLIVHRYHIPADKIEVVHNAIDLEEFTDFEYDRQTYLYLEYLKSEGYTVVATITRFTVQKGLTHFLRAAAKACSKYDKLVFLMAGDGEQRNELMALSAELGISDKVYFTGFVRGKQWRDAYHVADVFVMSSVSEPFGLTALEAAHHNNALLISRQSGVGEVLQSVFRFDFWDIDRLADQMVGVAASPTLQQTLKDTIKHEYTRLSWDDVADKCLQMYRNIRAKAII